MEIYGEIGILADDGEKVQCHVCGKWYKKLGRHIALHGMDAAEYRHMFGLNIRCPLASEESRAVSRDNCAQYFNDFKGKPSQKFIKRKRGSVPRSAQWKKNNGAAKKGLKHSPEARQKMSDSVRAAYSDPATRERIVAALKAPETRAKMSEKAKIRMQDPVYKEQVLSRLRSNSHTPGANAKRSVALKGKPKKNGRKAKPTSDN